MDAVVDKKVHKCKLRNKDVCDKACIREHNRLVKMNHQYDRIRSLLDISPQTSKVKTLVEAIRYIKKLTHVLETTDQANDGGIAQTANQQLMETEETDTIIEPAEELEMKCTTDQSDGAILPEETQENCDDDTDMLEYGSNSLCKPMEVDEGDYAHEYNEQLAELTEVIQQPPEDLTNVSRTRKLSCVSNNCLIGLKFKFPKLKFLIENLFNLDNMFENMDVEPTTSGQGECSLITNDEEDIEMQLPSFASLVESIQSSPIGDPFPGVVQEPETMQVDCSLTTELERNLGEVDNEWLSYGLLDNDTFFNEQDRLMYMDTDTEAWNGMKEDEIFVEHSH